MKIKKPTSAIEKMIDEACGITEKDYQSDENQEKKEPKQEKSDE